MNLFRFFLLMLPFYCYAMEQEKKSQSSDILIAWLQINAGTISYKVPITRITRFNKASSKQDMEHQTRKMIKEISEPRFKDDCFKDMRFDKFTYIQVKDTHKGEFIVTFYNSDVVRGMIKEVKATAHVSEKAVFSYDQENRKIKLLKTKKDCQYQDGIIAPFTRERQCDHLAQDIID